MIESSYQRHKTGLLCAAALLSAAALTSCKDGESYSDLLKDEEHAVNWFLSGQKVAVDIPEDNNFIIGEDAPFYKIDSEGKVYMKIINPGDKENMVEAGDMVYFRFLRRNIKQLYKGIDAPVEGNADDMNSDLAGSSFVYDNYNVSSSSNYGSGIQMPLKYVGNGAEVCLVLKAYYGFYIDQSQCVPYEIKLWYYKADY